MFCENCGKPILADAVFCENCGCKVNHGEKKQSINRPKSNRKAVIIVVVLFVLVAIFIFAGIFAMGKAKQKKQQQLVEELTEEMSVDSEIELQDEPQPDEEITSEEVQGEEAVPEKDFSYIDVESQVKIIREEYNLIVDAISNNYYSEESLGSGVTAYYDGGELKSVVAPKGENGVEYTQYYYYDDGALMFAYYEASDSHRLYFYENQLMRWRYCKNSKKASEAVNYDWDDSAEYRDWENKVYNIGNIYL